MGNKLPLAFEFFFKLFFDFILRFFQFCVIDAVAVVPVNYYLKYGYRSCFLHALGAQVVIYFGITYISLLKVMWNNRG